MNVFTVTILTTSLLGAWSMPSHARPITEADTERFTQKVRVAADDVMKAKQTGTKPVVIFDNAKETVVISELVPEDAEDNAEYIAEKTRNDKIVEKFRTGAITPEEYQRQMIDEMFPITSSLKPQRVMVRHQLIKPELAKTISTPVVVIGSDEYSLEWFKANLGEIRRLHAFVLVTQVKNMNDYAMIRDYARDVQMQPSSADGFLKELGLSYYPVLVTQDGAFQ